MAQAPAEFIGKARVFRSAIAAEHRRAVAAMERITLPLKGQFYHRQMPSPGCFARVARAWREQLPSVGGLNRTIAHDRNHLTITETRAGDCKLWFPTWDEGAAEAAIEVSRATLIVSPEQFQFHHVPIASIALHALARRFQRAWDNSDSAIYADLLALAWPSAEVLARGGDFNVPVADGQWVGAVTEIEDRGKAVSILVVRSFVSVGMTAREWIAPPAEAGALP